jgi:hypothetical protein
MTLIDELPITAIGTIDYDVLIATPGRQFHAEYVRSLIETTQLLNREGITYGFLNKYSSFVPSARELTATDSNVHNWNTNTIGGGKYIYKKIFWIDSDIEWRPEDFLRLYNSDLDVVSGLYQTDVYGTVAVNMPDDKGRPVKVNKKEFMLDDQPIEVNGVGFGFVAMKSGVFEMMPRPWFKIRFVRWDHTDFDTNVGEDYSWCMNAKDTGFKIWVDPMVTVAHHKETVYVV